MKTMQNVLAVLSAIAFLSAASVANADGASTAGSFEYDDEPEEAYWYGGAQSLSTNCNKSHRVIANANRQTYEDAQHLKSDAALAYLRGWERSLREIAATSREVCRDNKQYRKFRRDLARGEPTPGASQEQD